MRFQPIIVPRPSAMATQIFTQFGMNLVERSSSFLIGVELRDFVGASVRFPCPCRGSGSLRRRGTCRCERSAPCRAASLPASHSCRTWSPISSTSSASAGYVPSAILCAWTYSVTAGRGSPRIAKPAPCASMILRGGVRRLRELGGMAFRQRAVQRIGGRRDADEDQHDEAHALLAVVGAVEERHAGAGEDQQAADPQRRRRGALGAV